MSQTVMKTRKSTAKPVVVAKKSVGRPSVELNFNFGNRAFKVLDVKNRYAKSKDKNISKIAILTKIKKLIVGQVKNADGKVLVLFGRDRSSVGRPHSLFKWVTDREAQQLVAEQEAQKVVENQVNSEVAV